MTPRSDPEHVTPVARGPWPVAFTREVDASSSNSKTVAPCGGSDDRCGSEAPRSARGRVSDALMGRRALRPVARVGPRRAPADGLAVARVPRGPLLRRWQDLARRVLRPRDVPVARRDVVEAARRDGRLGEGLVVEAIMAPILTLIDEG